MARLFQFNGLHTSFISISKRRVGKGLLAVPTVYPARDVAWWAQRAKAGLCPSHEFFTP